MNKLLLNLCVGAFLCGTAHAAVILNEPFNYVDGPLTTGSGGVWANHSGTAGQLDVASGKAKLTQSEGEDVNAFLSGRPYANGNLYASLVINLTGLPSGAGGYFAHFKDDGNGFRARIFVSTNGAAAGSFRVAIVNGTNAFAAIPRNLTVGQDYTLVLRYDTAAATSTLWISPDSEVSTTDRADATDVITSVGITTFALRQSLSSGAGMGTLTVDDLKVGTSFGDVTGGNDPSLNPPNISSLPDQRIAANASTAELPFVVGDGESSASSLVPSAGSDNPALVPVESVVFGGSEANRTVRVTPAANQQGSALISVTVTDENGNTASRNFRVTVGAPTISSIASQTIPKDTIISDPIPFTVGDSENDEITFSAISTNEAVVTSANVTVDGTGSNRTVTILPTPGVAGLTRITLIATDGFNSVSNSFVVTVFQTLGVDVADSFDYPDGSVTTNSVFVWGTHSGTTGQTQVIQGQLAISSAQSEDINVFLVNGPYLPSAGWLLYSRFTVNFSASPRPSAAGDYFAHFRGTSTGFGARVFASTTGAAAGKLRLGIANNANTPSAVIPVDIETNVTYTVVTRLNVGTGQSTLWINPNFESDASVTATDSASPFEVWTYAFRQSGGIGSLVVDDLKISTAFLDVITPRPSLTITHSGSDIQISWPTAFTGYTVQYKDDLSAATWTGYTGAVSSQGDNSVVRFSGVSGQRFFQLVK